jgi:hypothetical protein
MLSIFVLGTWLAAGPNPAPPPVAPAALDAPSAEAAPAEAAPQRTTTTTTTSAAAPDDAAPSDSAPNLFVIGHAVLGGGVLSLAASTACILAAVDAERTLRASIHTREEADSLLLGRGIAGGFAWPTLALGVGGIVAGVTTLIIDHNQGER